MAELCYKIHHSEDWIDTDHFECFYTVKKYNYKNCIVQHAISVFSTQCATVNTCVHALTGNKQYTSAT